MLCQQILKALDTMNLTKMNKKEKRYVAYALAFGFFIAGQLNCCQRLYDDPIYNKGDDYQAEPMTPEDFIAERELEKHFQETFGVGENNSLAKRLNDKK